MSNNSKIILSLLLMVLIVGGGIYWWQQQEEPSLETEEVKIEEETMSVVSEEQENVKTWEGNGFSFAYPSELIARENWWSPPSLEGLWKQDEIEMCLEEDFDLEAYIEALPPGDFTAPCTEPYVRVNSETTDLSLDEFIAEEIPFSVRFVYDEQITLGENDFTKAVLALEIWDDTPISGTTMYFTKRENLIVWFGMVSRVEIHEISDLPSDDLTEIMSTLKFE